MLLTIIAIIVAAIIVWFWWEESFGFFDWIVASLLCLFVLFFVWLGVLWVVGSSLPHTIQHENVEVVALQDGATTQGSFFIGTGFVDGKQVYSFYERSGEGVKLEQVDAKDVVVYQSASKPHIVRESGCEGGWQWIAPCVYDRNKVTEIHVPAGTIKENFVLDAK